MGKGNGEVEGERKRRGKGGSENGRVGRRAEGGRQEK